MPPSRRNGRRRPAGGHRQPVARRVGQAGARGHRRAPGRRRHARARLRHRCDSQRRQPAAEGLAEAAARQQRPVHLDDRVRRPQGKSEGDQGLERSGPPGRDRDHAESEDLRRRALELSRGVGLCAAAARRQRGIGQGVRRPSCSRTCRCSIPAHAAPRRRSCSAVSATCSSPGRTKRCSRPRCSARTKSRSSCRR